MTAKLPASINEDSPSPVAFGVPKVVESVTVVKPTIVEPTVVVEPKAVQQVVVVERPVLCLFTRWFTPRS